jgi:plasmid stabilization system protein ParE
MTYSFHPEASSDLNQAVDYYEDCQSGLGSEFLDEVEAVIKRILLHPKASSELSRGTRRCLTSQIPYALFTKLKQTIAAS